MHYSISYTPVQELAHLPVRLNPALQINQGRKRRDKQAGDTIFTEEPIWTGTAYFTLLEILHAIYYDISFVGGPADQAIFTESIRQSMNEIKSKLDSNG